MLGSKSGQVVARMSDLYLSPVVVNLSGQTVITQQSQKNLVGEGGASQFLGTNHKFNLSGVTSGFIGRRWLSSLRLGFGSNFDYLTTKNSSSKGGASSSSRWLLNNNVYASVTIFPRSRLPFNFSLNLRQQIAKERGVVQNSFNYRLSQEYSPLSRRSLKLVAMLSGTVVDADSSSSEQAFVFDISDRFLDHDLSAEVEWKSFDNDNLTQTSTSLIGKHDWQSQSVRVSDFFNFITTADSSDRQVEVVQFSNNTRWVPLLYQNRLDFTAVSRVFFSEFSTSGVSANTEHYAHNSRLNLRPNDNVRLSGGFGLSWDGIASVFTNESLAAGYSSDRITLYGWEYDWSADSNLSMAQIGSENSESVGVGVAHGVKKYTSGDGMADGTITLDQSLSGDLHKSTGEEDFTLQNSVNYYQSGHDEDSGSLGFQISFSDARRLSAAVESQFLSVRVDHSVETRQGGRLVSDVSFELSRSDDESSGGEEVGYFVEGRVRYIRDSVFGVPRLSYLAKAEADVDGLIVARDEESKSVVFSWLISNELRWSWGLLSLAALSEVTGARDVADALVRFELRRQWRP